jgi:hypothetical protein
MNIIYMLWDQFQYEQILVRLKLNRLNQKSGTTHLQEESLTSFHSIVSIQLTAQRIDFDFF